jgi:hypothetical protein
LVGLLITYVMTSVIRRPYLRYVRFERISLFPVIWISWCLEDPLRQRISDNAVILFLSKLFGMKQLVGKLKEVMPSYRTLKQ